MFNLVQSNSSSSYTLSSRKRSLQLHGQTQRPLWMDVLHLAEKFSPVLLHVFLNGVLIPTSTKSLFFFPF